MERESAESTVERLGLEDVIDHDPDGPRLEDVAEGFGQDGDERHQQRLPVRPEQARNPKMSGQRAQYTLLSCNIAPRWRLSRSVFGGCLLPTVCRFRPT